RRFGIEEAGHSADRELNAQRRPTKLHVVHVFDLLKRRSNADAAYGPEFLAVSQPPTHKSAIAEIGGQSTLPRRESERAVFDVAILPRRSTLGSLDDSQDVGRRRAEGQRTRRAGRCPENA